MPLYEYRCRACGQISERLSSYDAPQTLTEQCPKCGQAAVLDKQVSVSSFRITGGGVHSPTSTLD